jgi:hypothetical protein
MNPVKRQVDRWFDCLTQSLPSTEKESSNFLKNLFESTQCILIEERTRAVGSWLINEMNYTHSEMDTADTHFASYVKSPKYRTDLWTDQQHSDACMNCTMNNPIRTPNPSLVWSLRDSQCAWAAKRQPDTGESWTSSIDRYGQWKQQQTFDVFSRPIEDLRSVDSLEASLFEWDRIRPDSAWNIASSCVGKRNSILTGSRLSKEWGNRFCRQSSKSNGTNE